VFSPYYAAARRRGAADPAQHVAINVALYGDARRWTMTERGESALSRTADRLQIGPSALLWDGKTLEIDLDERAVPLPRRVRGRVRLIPESLPDRRFDLDAFGAHHWQPIAPSARMSVELDTPALRWSGHAYFDSNTGSEPLETRLRRWHWSRSRGADGTRVLYDVEARDGARTGLALRFGPDGEVSAFDPPRRVALPSSRWRIRRATRSEDGTAAVVRTLEDTPFYARSLVSTTLGGQRVASVHESLDLDRFDDRVVQAMLAFRMPRRAHWTPRG
jgi:carotenoid 1,2-hydratase